MPIYGKPDRATGAAAANLPAFATASMVAAPVGFAYFTFISADAKAVAENERFPLDSQSNTSPGTDSG